MPDPIRVAISGAAGHIGYSLIFRIAAGGLFGPEQPVELALLDLPESFHLLHADEMELKDCAFPLLAGVRIGTDPVEVFRGADWVILLAGRPMDLSLPHRYELVRANVPIYVEHGRAINAACPTARILVVANPPNTNCQVARMHAQDVPQEHWFALNRLDRMRATYLIAEKAGVPVGRVNRVCVWGNHSESTYVDLHNAFVDEVPAYEVIRDTNWSREVLQPAVTHRSREVHELRGASPAATAAQAILGTIRSITTPTPFNRRFGAGVVTVGHHYGVPPGIIFGMPLRTEDGKEWSLVRGLYLDDFAQERIAANVAELEHEMAVACEAIDCRP